MSITDELREWAEDNTLRDRVLTTYPPQHAVHGVLETLLRIADHIDAEHERAMAAAALIAGVPITDEDMAEHGWIRLPKDANGVPIRVGDVLTDGEYTFVVGELAAFGGGSWSIRNEDEDAWKACDVTHHHKPTVEDVLRELVAAYMDTPLDDSNDGEFFAEYAAKLRLAGDAE